MIKYNAMKSEERARKSMERPPEPNRAKKKGPGLQARMTISYLGVTAVTVLLSELLIVLLIVTVLTESALLDKVVLTTTRHTAQVYALEAATQASGTTLDAHATFQPGQPASIALPGGDVVPGGDPSKVVPYIDTQVPYIDPSHPAPKQVLGFALLITPNDQVFASSYPARYPASTLVTRLLPDQQQVQLVLNALAGKDGSMLTSIS